MNKIRILPDCVSNKIAAGEVVERPASVLKELLENSLDAGASQIKISIEGSGIKLILVSDNGHGMSPDDALLCIEAHATSKIKNAEDLNAISTFGFRGEAIPSIASVSKFRLRTKIKEASEGTEIIIDGGKLISSKPIGCANGTEVSVRELFFNVPARRKFLASLDTEEKHICELIYTIALANFAVSFEFFSEGKEVFRSAASDDIKSRISAFFGKSFLDSLIPVEFEDSGIEISGFVAKHGLTRSSRREQRIFINGRPAEVAVVYAGIKDAYSSLTPHGRFPPLILFINTNPVRVDVNVHPAKKEVRFREPSIFRKTVEKAIRGALRNSQNATIHLSPEISFKQLLDSSVVNYDPEEKARKREFNDTELPGIHSFSDDEKELKKDENTQIIPPKNNKIFPVLRVIGSLDNTYILASSADGLVIIDQHAAHERILFEKILKARENTDGYLQKLLVPVTMELSTAEAIFISKNLAEFEKVGFELENFGGNTVIVHSIPYAFPQENVIFFIRDIIDNLSLEGLSKPSFLDIAKKACVSAVKSHDNLKNLEVENLLKNLALCEMPFCCPHGRPTMINISIQELQKRFGRSIVKN